MRQNSDLALQREPPIWRPHRLISAAMMFGVVLIFLLGSLVYSHDSLDDPYISYRYARNLSRGAGLRWNVGEPPVEGYTNFLWVVIHAPFLAVGASPLLVSRLVSIFAGLGLIAVIYSPFNKAVQSLAWRTVLALLVASCPVLLFYAQSGMETFLFATFIFVGCLFWSNNRLDPARKSNRLVASGILGLAALTRPEAAMVFGILWLFELFDNASRPWAVKQRRMLEFSLPFALVWLPYMAWRLYYFGFLFPNTFYAKHASNNLRNLPLGIDYAATAVGHYFLAPLAVLLGLLAGRGRAGADEPGGAQVRRSILLPLSTTIICYLLFIIWAGGDTSAFPSSRLLAPIIPVAWLCLVVGLQQTLASATPVREWAMAFAVLVVCGIAWIPDGFRLIKIANPEIRTTRSIGDSLAPVWQKAFHLADETPGALALWLRQQTGPEDLIALPWAGRVSYYSDRPILDILGLNDVHIAHSPSPAQRGIDVKIDPEYVLSRKPALIFVNVDACYAQGNCTFEQAGGWLLRDKELLELIKQQPEYEIITSAPTKVCAFRRR
jgi:hypothetical protein